MKLYQQEQATASIGRRLLEAHRLDGAVEVEYRVTPDWRGWVVLDEHYEIIEEYQDYGET